MDMIFAGPPGTGKTSAARILTSAIKADVADLTASSKTTAGDISQFIGPSLYDEPKVILIEEAEFLSKNTQAALRRLIEEGSKYCRFIVTTNNINKIDPARCSSECRSRPWAFAKHDFATRAKHKLKRQQFK